MTTKQNMNEQKKCPFKYAIVGRKEIGQVLPFTVDQIRKNEKAWGWDKARRDVNARCVRYLAIVVWNDAVRRGWV